MTYVLTILAGYLGHGALRVYRTKPKGAKAILATLVGGGGGPQEPL